jgi:hypothetical protein
LILSDEGEITVGDRLVLEPAEQAMGRGGPAGD